MFLNRRQFCLQAAFGVALPAAQADSYDSATVADETWLDPTRASRAVPVRIRWPAVSATEWPRSVVLFSHGLGGTRDGGAVWGEVWVKAGFVVVHLQHPGSDLPAVRANARSFADRDGLRVAGNARQLLARLRDVQFVIDEIGRRHSARQPQWSAVRADRMGMSGHSFGAHTTLGMAGQRYPGFDGVSETRLVSFIAFSPTMPLTGDPQQAFAGINRPLLSITGSRDDDVIGNGATPDRRMAVFSALPAGHKAQLVLQDADHMTFAGQTGRSLELRPRLQVTRDLQAQQHALVSSISTDWWRATLLDDTAARERLRAPTDLGRGDSWQQK